MSWDEAFANHYEEWSAHDGRRRLRPATQQMAVVELCDRVWRRDPAAAGHRQRIIGIDFSPLMLHASPVLRGCWFDLREGDM